MKSLARKNYQFIRLPMSLFFDSPVLTGWMRNSGIPYLAKLDTQSRWTCSRTASLFFGRFDTSKVAKLQIGPHWKERFVKVDFKIRRQDLKLIEIQARFMNIRVIRNPKNVRGKWKRYGAC